MSNTIMKPVQIIRAGQAADVYIYGDLVASQWFEDETSADSFRRELQSMANDGVIELNVHIDSYGGAVSTGWAVYNALKDYPGTVNTFADGFVASAAVYPFLAGSRRAANPMSAFFLHQAWTYVDGNADELRKAADDLEKFNAIGLEAFAAVGIDKDKVLELEKDETWLTASEAMELGLATEVIDRSDGQSAQQSVRSTIIQALKAYKAGESREKAPEEAEDEQRETAPNAQKAQGEEKTNHLMAFFARSKKN